MPGLANSLFVRLAARGVPMNCTSEYALADLGVDFTLENVPRLGRVAVREREFQLRKEASSTPGNPAQPEPRSTPASRRKRR
jgi:hypothetical protein